MLASRQARVLVVIFILIIIAIPGGAYLLSKRQAAQNTIPFTRESGPSLDQLDKENPASVSTPPKSTSLDERVKETKVTLPVSFGPVLNLKLILEGRPSSNQAGKVFVGIAEGDPTQNPRYLLSFTIDLPASGLFEGLSLAGLDTGSRYSAYLKGPAQIATASAFIMGASVTSLNSGQPLTLLSGDFNEDNVINSADFSLVKSALGANENSSSWNANLDLNKDGTINSFDLSYVVKNFGKTGTSGIWVSTPISTSSGHPSGSPGYWLWVPR